MKSLLMATAATLALGAFAVPPADAGNHDNAADFGQGVSDAAQEDGEALGDRASGAATDDGQEFGGNVSGSASDGRAGGDDSDNNNSE